MSHSTRGLFTTAAKCDPSRTQQRPWYYPRALLRSLPSPWHTSFDEGLRHLHRGANEVARLSHTFAAHRRTNNHLG